MRKLFILAMVILFVAFYSMPAMAIFGTDIEIDNTQNQGQIQGQDQEQNQGQGQGQGQKQEVNIAADPREHLGVGNLEYGKLGVYKESSKYGAEFTTFAKLTAFKKTFSYEHARKHYGKPFGKGKCITIGGSYNGRHEGDPSKEVTVIEPEDVDLLTMYPVGFLTIKVNPKWLKKWFVKAEDKQVDSFTVLQKGILSACLMQGDYLLKVDEGAQFMSRNIGKGIGWNSSGGVINDMDNRGRAASASGGTGFSSGSAWNRTMPWMVLQVFKNR